jgi:mitotic-spindle organizing protein 1
MDQINQLEFEESKESLEILFEMSQILNCGISRETLSILITMIEKGVNPEALVQVVKEMRNENFAMGNLNFSQSINNNNSNINNNE